MRWIFEAVGYIELGGTIWIRDEENAVAGALNPDEDEKGI